MLLHIHQLIFRTEQLEKVCSNGNINGNDSTDEDTVTEKQPETTEDNLSNAHDLNGNDKDQSDSKSHTPSPAQSPVEQKKSKGPRALRRRHGKKMERSKVKRRSSINGHW